MKAPFCAITFCVALAFALLQNAHANLVTNGNFTSVSYSGALPLTTATFGQFGSGYTGTTPKPTLTVAGWTTAGYNYVYSPNTADTGHNTTGAIAGQPNQAPGQFNNSAGYGDTYLYGPTNGGAATTTGGVGNVEAVPGGGNFIAMDGVYEVSAVTQTITGLKVGTIYVLKFWWAGAQQESFTGPTTEWVTVNMGGTFNSTGGGTGGNFTGGTTFTTGTVSVASQSFSGWMQQTFSFTATSGTETLSFLAGGTPAGEPPFSLVGGVDLEVIPDYSNWMIFAGFGAACILFEIMRRRRQSKQASFTKGTLTESFPIPAKAALFSGTTKPPISA